MNSYKQLRKNRKKEELPSFLVGLTEAPEDISLAPKPHPSKHYLGPIFVGLCTNYQHHPPPHSLKLGSFHQPQFIMFPGADDISKLLYAQLKADKVTQTMTVKKRQIKRPKIYHDIYPHKCTGSKRMFIPDITPHIIDLGKTRSIIEGEASVEIPLPRSRVPLRYRRKSVGKRENDVITLSDLREERRMFMSYKERIAHAHFPKEFTTVRVIGPPIPASITITKLPSKRRTESQFNLEMKSETHKADDTEETERTGKRSMKPKPKQESHEPTSKRPTIDQKSIDQIIGDQEKVEEETEIRGEVYDEYSAGEEEEIYGEGLEELEWEIGESDEREKEEDEDATTEEREERTTIVKKESSAEAEERKTITEERKTLTEERKTITEERKTVAEERKTIAEEDPKTEVKEETKVHIKEEAKAEVKEEKTRGVQIKQEEAGSEQKARANSASSATSRKETAASRISATSATSRKETDSVGGRPSTTSKNKQETVE